MTPDGKSAYVTNADSDTVSQYTIDPSTGTLSPKTPAAVATGDGPLGVAATPDSTSAYVANEGSALPGGGDTVSQYTIDPNTGALSPKTPATVPAGSASAYLAVTPDARSAYVTNIGSDNISQYTIDPSTGALSPKTPTTVGAGAGPDGVAVTPLAASPLPGPQRSDYKNAGQFCKAERVFLGDIAFAKKYGTNRNGANAHGKCVSRNH